MREVREPSFDINGLREEELVRSMRSATFSGLKNIKTSRDLPDMVVQVERHRR